jgi:hypothetical protein
MELDRARTNQIIRKHWSSERQELEPWIEGQHAVFQKIRGKIESDDVSVLYSEQHKA